MITLSKKIDAEIKIDMEDIMELLGYVDEEETQQIMAFLTDGDNSYWGKLYFELFEKAKEKYTPFELEKILDLD